ncbi:MAG: rRNA maturation RNase YbeY [Marinilabiliales bacterium]|nr:MAG: rRNA maturation RNase YbeY [Marinilabiliales bacterium]
MEQTGVINFFSEDITWTLRNKRLIRTWLSRLFFKEGLQVGEVNYIFCSDRYLFDLNVKYLEHHTLTDTITFTYSTDNEPITGDVFISYERIKENAQKMKVKFSDEVLRLIAHGALHLCGYNDKLPEDKRVMTNKEDFYLLQYSKLG